jgi:alpha-L-fucosidase 2
VGGGGGGGGGAEEEEEQVFELARRWHLQRMIHGMLGRGRYPIKFNGGLFTIGQPADIWNGPDYRAYGGFYWHQNTRMSYWSMLGSGDYPLVRGCAPAPL